MDLGEADRIVTLYSRDDGKVRAVAKGVRRTTSRSAGHLEPFTLSDVLLAVGRELDVISQADTLDAFRAVREDLVLTTHAYYLAEMVDLLTEDRMENRAVFDAPGRRPARSGRRPPTSGWCWSFSTCAARRPRLPSRAARVRRAAARLIEPDRNHFSAFTRRRGVPRLRAARADRARHWHVRAEAVALRAG